MSNAPTLLEEIPAARRTLTNCPTHVGTGRLHVVRPRGSGRTGPAYSRGDRRPGKQGRGSRSPEGGDHAAQTTPRRSAASSNSPEMDDLYSQHGPPQFSMVLSLETRNVPCAANHYLVKEPFLSAAGSRLSTPKVAETFRFRCSGLLGCDASRRISFGWNSSQPPEIPLGICITSGLFSAAFETSDLRTDIV
jgi:hypothetical protein